MYRSALVTVPVGILISWFSAQRLASAEGGSVSKSAKEDHVVSQEAMAIHRRGYVWDGHNDLPWAMREAGDRNFSKFDIALDQPTLDTDIPKLRRGNVGAQFWSVYVPAKERFQGTAFQSTMEQIEIVRSMVQKYPETFGMALTAADVRRLRNEGKIASLMGVEGGHSIENSIGLLRRLYAEGVRYMTLTHGDTLDWADAATDEPKNQGLSPFGEEVVREMNALGMLVDLSHVSPETMLDALAITTAPIIFSHSSARAVADHPRNVPDEVLPLVRANGGVVMVNFFSGFVEPQSAINMQKMFDVRREFERKYGKDVEAAKRAYQQWKLEHPILPGEASIVVEHIVHLVEIAGIDHVGIGSDFDGVDTLPRGLEDVSCYPLITELLLRRGYSESDIHKIMYQNILRVFEGCEAAKTKGTP